MGATISLSLTVDYDSSFENPFFGFISFSFFMLKLVLNFYLEVSVDFLS